MKLTENIRLVEYTPRQELANCLTHGIGALLAAACGIAEAVKAAGQGKTALISALIHALAFTAVYTISTVYHALPPGEGKKTARLLDHMAIPVLLAATTTPCALITLYRISPVHGMIVFCTAWFCALFGVFGKLFFFEKLKAVCIAVYFIGGAAMLFSAVPRLGSIDKTGFALLCAGCAAYGIGAIFCRLGIKKPCLHAVFHVFVLAGSLIHFYVIYRFIL